MTGYIPIRRCSGVARIDGRMHRFLRPRPEEEEQKKVGIGG